MHDDKSHPLKLLNLPILLSLSKYKVGRKDLMFLQIEIIKWWILETCGEITVLYCILGSFKTGNLRYVLKETSYQLVVSTSILDQRWEPNHRNRHR